MPSDGKTPRGNWPVWAHKHTAPPERIVLTLAVQVSCTSCAKTPSALPAPYSICRLSREALKLETRLRGVRLEVVLAQNPVHIVQEDVVTWIAADHHDGLPCSLGERDRKMATGYLMRIVRDMIEVCTKPIPGALQNRYNLCFDSAFWRIVPLVSGTDSGQNHLRIYMHHLILTILVALAAVAQVGAQENRLEGRRAFRDPMDTARKLQMVEKVFPVRVVKHSKKVWELKRAGHQFAPSYIWTRTNYSMSDFHRRTYTSAMLILHNGKIVTETYLAGSGPKTRFLGYSLSKCFTSTLLGMAIEDGYIKSLDNPLTSYLPGLIGSGYEQVSIKQALQMLSGLEFMPEDNNWRDEQNPGARVYQASLIAQRYRYIEGANALKAKFPVGSKFNYSDMDASIVGAVIENATRKRLATYMEEKLWKPAGMEHDAFWALDGPAEIGREVPALSFAATLRDYGRFGLLALNRGRAKGRQLVSSTWFEVATHPQGPPVQFGQLYENYPLGYGYYWWLRPNGDFTGEGAFGQFIYIAPRANVVIIKQSHWPKEWVDELETETFACFDAVIDALTALRD